MVKAISATVDKKRTILILQWLVTIVTSYLILFGKGEISADPLVHGLVVTFFLTVFALYRLPEEKFYHPYFDAVVLIVDTLFLSGSIALNRDVSWDLFLFYFFVLFLAAVGGSMLRIVFGSVIINLIYIGLFIQQGKSLSQIAPDLFVRVPFLFGASILYGYLAESANKEKQRAEMAEHREHLKMSLVSTLAHDIKNPLGIIMGYAETMKMRFVDRPEGKEEADILDRIQENARRIVKLVTGFLEASKAESGKLEMVWQPVAVNSLLEEVARQQQSDLQRKGLKLELKLDAKLPEVPGDETQLDRVFWNLIGNAVKFTPAGGKITISSRRDDGYICVDVEDTGMGIPPNELPLLFTQFQRLKGSSNMEGTGLGLFIVKTIVEAHKGTVRVESENGRGATFTVRLPSRS